MNLLFVFYLFSFCFLIKRLTFFRESGLSFIVLLTFFFIRLAAGLVSGYLNLYHFYNSDTKGFHERGLEEYHLLLHNPLSYFQNIIVDTHGNHYGGFFSISKSYWNDLKNNLIDKIYSVFDIFSFGDYYTNIICFNFLVFIASISLYKYFLRLFPDRKWPLIIAIFLLPCFIYFSSTIHRDGLVFILLVGIVVNFSKLIVADKPLLRLAYFLICFFFILMLRNFICLLLIPGLLSWYLSTRLRFQKIIVFFTVYLIFVLLFFLSGTLTGGRMDMMKIISERQNKYMELSDASKSKIATTALAPNVSSFVSHLPSALDNAFLRPHLIEQHEVYNIAFSLEMDIYLFLIVLYLFFKKKYEDSSVVLFCVFSSTCYFILTGLTVPISITIIRYKSAFLPFLLIPILCLTDWAKIKGWIKYDLWFH